MGVPMYLSLYGTTSLEGFIMQNKGNPYMDHMCMVKDRSVMQQLLRHAEGTDLLQNPIYLH